MLPSLEEAEVLDTMLSRSAVGQKLTSYCSFSTRQVSGESDGPEDFHVVIIDNGRSKALGTEFESVLQCIRCGACLNVCPVYRHIGGHGYGSIYPGPIGAVLSPILGGYEQFGDLPYASSLCGACTETCPVRIPLHELLIKHRIVMNNQLHMDHSFNDTIMKGIGTATGTPAMFKLALHMDHAATGPMAKKGPITTENLFNHDGVLHSAPSMAAGWTDVRDAPRPPKYHDSFRGWFKQHQAEKGGHTDGQ